MAKNATPDSRTKVALTKPMACERDGRGRAQPPVPESTPQACCSAAAERLSVSAMITLATAQNSSPAKGQHREPRCDADEREQERPAAWAGGSEPGDNGANECPALVGPAGSHPQRTPRRPKFKPNRTKVTGTRAARLARYSG